MKSVRTLTLAAALFGALMMLQRLGPPSTRTRPQAATLPSPHSFPVEAQRSAAGDTIPPQQLRDFETRCHAPGVLLCEGFDSADTVRPASYPASGLYPAGDGKFYGSIDTTVKASGAGSLRFEVPPHSGANASGYWRQYFGKGFGMGTTYYVQFRQRFSEEMLKTDWGDTTWKQVIFHNDGQTCTDLGITTAQYYHHGLPIMYAACGARMIATNNGNPPTMLQQGDYNCWYGRLNPKDCFMYPANEWVTFYFQVSIGHWDKADSAINAWVARDGQPYRQWIKIHDFMLQNAPPRTDYDSLTLLTYMTNKNSSVEHPAAYTWYDELIISSEPIAPPTASGGSN